MSRLVATRLAAFVAFALLLAPAWVFLAPAQLGGATEYAIVEGSSMEPALSDGDLAIVRSRGEVGVGDAVLYHDGELGVDVLHRIVRREHGAFVLKGDSNDFLDEMRPRPSDIEGALWFSVPHAGSVLIWSREPLHAALAVFFLTLVLLSGETGKTGRQRAPETR